MTQILLVDDHALFRASLSRLLADHPDLRVTGQCATVEEAIQLMESNTYDLVLLDYELGDRRGIDVAQAAKRIGFTGKILLVTVGLTPTEVRHLLNLGISGIFLKNSSPEELLDAIRSVCAGGNWMDPKYQQQVEASAAAGMRTLTPGTAARPCMSERRRMCAEMSTNCSTAQMRNEVRRNIRTSSRRSACSPMTRAG